MYDVSVCNMATTFLNAHLCTEVVCCCHALSVVTSKTATKIRYSDAQSSELSEYLYEC